MADGGSNSNNINNNPDTTFAPQSPDLSAAAYHDIEPLPPQHQQYRGSLSHTLTPFTPTDHSAAAAAVASSPWSAASPYGGRGAAFGSYFPQQQQQQQQQSAWRGFGGPHQQQVQAPQLFGNPSPFSKRESNGAAATTAAAAAAAAGRGAARGVGEGEGPGGGWDPMSPAARGKRIKTEADGGDDEEMAGGTGGATGALHAGVEVRTKFPVARIKRIMQSDEDVGKVAQVTPVVVSKALELFMIDLVTSAAVEAKSRSSKRVTAAHLKQAVMSNEKYRDWLGDIVGRAPDAPAAKAAKEDDSDDEFFHGGGGGGKKKKALSGGGAKRRKKKGGDDDDDF